MNYENDSFTRNKLIVFETRLHGYKRINTDSDDRIQRELDGANVCICVAYNVTGPLSHLAVILNTTEKRPKPSRVKSSQAEPSLKWSQSGSSTSSASKDVECPKNKAVCPNEVSHNGAGSSK